MWTQTLICLVCVCSIQEVCWRDTMCPVSLWDYADKKRGLSLDLEDMPTTDGVCRWSLGKCQRQTGSVVGLNVYQTMPTSLYPVGLNGSCSISRCNSAAYAVVCCWLSSPLARQASLGDVALLLAIYFVRWMTLCACIILKQLPVVFNTCYVICLFESLYILLL